MFALYNAAATGDKKYSSLWYGAFSHFPENQVTAAVSTRFGGTSGGIFTSLNLALHVGDDPSAVIANRQTFLTALGLDLSRLVTAEQVHGTHVAIVTEKEAGRGSRLFSEALPQTDALATNVPQLPLMLFFADCVPLLFFDPEKKAVAIAHAGWRGTVGRIGAKTIEKMTAAFGTNPADVLAAIAPSIGVDDYEVGDEVAAKFIAEFGEAANQKYRIVQRTDDPKPHLDLVAANRCVLEEAGVLSENIVAAAISTVANSELFFSYRRDAGQTGRIGAVISLK